MLLLDTNVLIDVLRGREAARAALRRATAAATEMAGSVLTRAELLAGMRAGEHDETHRLMGGLSWIPVTPEIADAAGELARAYAGTHPGVELADYVLAATAQAFGADLWTRNPRHFPMFPDLAAPY